MLTTVGIPVGIAVLAILGTINGFMLQSILTRLSRLEEKLDQSQNKSDCREARDACQKIVEGKAKQLNEERSDIWDAFSHHSHTGLPPESKVTR